MARRDLAPSRRTTFVGGSASRGFPWMASRSSPGAQTYPAPIVDSPCQPRLPAAKSNGLWPNETEDLHPGEARDLAVGLDAARTIGFCRRRAPGPEQGR